jgi:DNA adenine methylase
MAVQFVKPARPALRYYGSKFALAPWIIQQFPPHEVYVEPFAGSLWVLIQKAPVKLETANDLDGRVVNFFEVLRAQPDALIHLLRLTPWAETEYRQSHHCSQDPLEEARRFFCHCWMSIQGGPYAGKSGFRFQKSVKSRYASPVSDLFKLDHLFTVAERLNNVQWLQREALEVIALFAKTEEGLLYVDPPYVRATRSGARGYRHETSADLHQNLFEVLQTVKGFCVLSGYQNPFYELYEQAGWQRVDQPVLAQNGGKRIESLWLSPRTVKALEKTALPLFHL